MDDYDQNNPLRDFTFVGRLWVVICVLLGMGLGVAYLAEMLPGFPTGSYPLMMFFVPVGLVMIVVYALGYWVLCLCGVRMRKPPEDGGAE